MASITIDLGLAETDDGKYTLVVRTTFRGNSDEFTKGPFDTPEDALECGQKLIEDLKSEGYQSGALPRRSDA